MKRRVVITGMGALTPVGNDVDSFWNSIKNGICGIDNITKFDTTRFKTKLAAELKGFDEKEHLDRKEINRLDGYSKYALVAAEEAVKDSGIDLDLIDHDRFGVFVSSGIGGLTTMQNDIRKSTEFGPSKMPPFFITMAIGNMAAGNIAIKYKAYGPCHSIVTACATSTHSIGEAYNYIRFGLSDVMITGGAEEAINETGIAGFEAIKAVNFTDDKARASIPFDKERSGFVMGEGAGILVLEEYEHAIRRGAHIYAEIAGYGSTCDAYHITAPSGVGATKCMNLAMKDAGITAADISYINAHGTSTEVNDKFETQAIKDAFGDYAKSVPISSTKSMTGHLLGGAGAVEAIICAKAIEEGFVPPTAGYKVKDDECDLDYIPNMGREVEVNYALTNSLGFGGHNGTLILKKVKE